MTSRNTFSGSSTGPVTGPAFLDQYSLLMDVLFDASSLPLTGVGGTANAVTAALDPVLPVGGLVDGMKFTLTWAAANTAGVTLALNGGAAVPVLDASGAALVAGAVTAGLRSVIEYVGGAFRILTGTQTGGGTSGTPSYYWKFTASGTWTKPVGLSDDAIVWVEMWGGGGSGRRNTSANDAGGGGGGSYIRAAFRAGDLPSSVAVGVGAGGAAMSADSGGQSGGASSFGALLSAPGGTGGLATTTPGGAKGTIGTTAAHAVLAEAGGSGGAFVVAGIGADLGGGGGGGSTSGGSIAGGTSRYGGSGGAGGNPGQPGTVPGGGGGGNGSGGGGTSSGAGARGEVRIWI